MSNEIIATFMSGPGSKPRGISSAAAKARDNQAFTREISVLGFDPNHDTLRSLVTARLYTPLRPNSSTITAIIWVYTPDRNVCGSGKTSGFGYHRGSAALADAIYNAGIALSQDINGSGDAAMDRAVMAIARLAFPDYGPGRLFLHVAHP